MSPTRTRPQARKPRTERRAEIAAAALEIIGSRGFPALTTTALAEAIDLTSGALFRHFASREEILEEAVRLAARRVEATFPKETLPPRERLAALALARIRLLEREPGIAWLLRSEQARLVLSRRAVERLERLVARSRASIRDTLEEAVAAGVVRSDVPVDMLLLIFTATVHALMGRPGPGTRGKRAGAKHLARAIDGLLAMLAPAGAPDTRS